MRWLSISDINSTVSSIGKKLWYRRHVHHNSSNKYASRGWAKRKWLHVLWDKPFLQVQGISSAHAPVKFVWRVRRRSEIFSALPRFSNGRSTPFCNIFWRGMKEYDKFTTISNFVDTRGVFWLFGWGYFNDQSVSKTRKKAENWKFEIPYTNDQDVHTRQQTLKVSLKMVMSYFCESRSCMWRRSLDIRHDNRR